ncbi:MAG: hypothetical protein PHY93_16370 [Bacteriovorax sp.]|nr:hypothetical protein [Bacteriovorax sp.]
MFFSRNKDLLEPIGPLSEEKHIIWYGTNLPSFAGTSLSEGIIFFDFDDQDFDLEAFLAILDGHSILKEHFQKILISSKLTVKTFKKLQEDHKFIDGLLRSPIKLKDIETFVEDYKLVLNETREVMGGPKKKDFEDPINAKIQRKFDLIFSHPASKSNGPSKFESTVFNQVPDKFDIDDFQLDGDKPMSDSAQKKPTAEKSSPKLDFDFGGGGDTIEFENSSSPALSSPALSSPAIAAAPPKAESATKLAVVPDENDLEFTLDFGEEFPEIPSVPSAVAETPTTKNETLEMPALDFTNSDNELDALLFDSSIEEPQNSVSEETQKTIVFDPSQLSEFDSFEMESSGRVNSSADLMSTEEAKANIESTIKDILRPKNLDNTQELDLSSFSMEPEVKSVHKISTTTSKISDTGEFDLSSVDFSDKETPEEAVPESAKVVPQSHSQGYEAVEDYSSNSFTPSSQFSGSPHASFVSDEESTRVQATIRQLREEREELLNQIKIFKGGNRELEQDNLTLKAALDESKIEVSILRKRQMVELEDIKYRLSLNEERKEQALEKARQAIGSKEKLEQRVRIDFNQVKLREKELETKLEMLTIDVDLQVQSRDQKILELRRKIDSLEFNMENVSIKEQKSQDDKRKLEDKLNKIMKTLRHSIKNLEDDIDQASDAGQDNRPGADQRSGKA